MIKTSNKRNMCSILSFRKRLLVFSISFFFKNNCLYRTLLADFNFAYPCINNSAMNVIYIITVTATLARTVRNIFNL